MRRRKIVVTESELIRSIEKIIKEQAAMLGFGNMNGLSLGVSKPSDKYEEVYEDETLDLDIDNETQDGLNQEDYMEEDYDLEEGCGDDYEDDYEDEYEDEMGELEEDSGEFEDHYFNSLKGIRGSDVYSESTLKRLVRNELKEAQAKEAKKWIQGAVKRPGVLRKKLGVKNGEKISLEKINQEMRKLKANDSNKKRKGVQGLSKSDLRTYKQLNLAKTLRGLSKKKHAKESRKWVRK